MSTKKTRNPRFCYVLLFSNLCIILLISSYFIGTYFINTIQYDTTNIKLQIENDSQTTDLIVFLTQYKNRLDKPLVLVLNGGNTGDVLIAYGTLLLFNHVGLKYTFGTYADEYNHSILFYGGGGNFVGGYVSCRYFLKQNTPVTLNNELILLPHTIKDQPIVKEFEENVVLFARERVSYDYIRNISNFPHNMHLSKDMAFYVNQMQIGIELIKKYDINYGWTEITEAKVLNAYRTDKESANNIVVPDDNFDISAYCLCPYSLWFNNFTEIERIVASNMFAHISKYDIVYTDRLHIAIASSLLNKKCFVYPNSYYKNEAVFNYSLKNKFKSTSFVKDG